MESVDSSYHAVMKQIKKFKTKNKSKKKGSRWNADGPGLSPP